MILRKKVPNCKEWYYFDGAKVQKNKQLTILFGLKVYI